MPRRDLSDDEYQKSFMGLSSKGNFLLGISWGIALISLTGFFIMLAVLVNNSKNININDNINSPTAVAPPSDIPSLPPEPQADASKLSPITKADHIRGDFNAPITLIEFSDFECPYCRRHSQTVGQLLKDYQGKIRLVFRHFPLPMLHPNAPKDAEASECADEQGKFWEMHDKIFAADSSLTVEILKSYAKELGLDEAKFNECLDSGKYTSKVNAMSAEAQEAGVTGTPATFINGQLVKGALPYENFKQIIESLLK